MNFLKKRGVLLSSGILLLAVVAAVGLFDHFGGRPSTRTGSSAKAKTGSMVYTAESAVSVPASSEAETPVSTKNGLPVLMYHDIMTPSQKGGVKNGLVVTTDEFDRQMGILSRVGYKTASLADVESYIAGKSSLTNRVVVTFDDGYRTCGYLAAPILRKYGFHAVIFIITKYLDKPDETVNITTYAPFQYLNSGDLPKFSDVLEYASHTDNMHDYYKQQPMLISEPAQAVLSDLSLSRSRLGGTPYLAYPLGKYNDQTISLVRQAGFRLAFTTRYAFVQAGCDPYKVPRVEINAPMSDTAFQNLMGIK